MLITPGKQPPTIRIEAGPPPENFAAQWTALYESLVRRHGLKGIKAFSRAAFELQLSIPGMVVFRALRMNVSGCSLVV